MLNCNLCLLKLETRTRPSILLCIFLHTAWIFWGLSLSLSFQYPFILSQTILFISWLCRTSPGCRKSRFQFALLICRAGKWTSFPKQKHPFHWATIIYFSSWKKREERKENTVYILLLSVLVEQILFCAPGLWYSSTNNFAIYIYYFIIFVGLINTVLEAFSVILALRKKLRSCYLCLCYVIYTGLYTIISMVISIFF